MSQFLARKKRRHSLQSSTMSALCLTVLPFRLRIAKLAKPALPAYSHALLRILTADRIDFFSWAESNDDTISMISTLHMLQYLPRGADLTIAAERWRCIIVSEGEILSDSTGMICMVSEVLAKAGFSIFYVSGSTTDYVLVLDDQFDAVMEALAQSISIVVDRVEDPDVEAAEAAAVLAAAQHSQSESAKLNALATALAAVGAAPMELPVSFAPASDLSCARMKLQTLPDRLVLHTVPALEIGMHFRRLLKLVFFSPSSSRFFSFLWVDDQLSLILDVQSYLRFIAEDGADEATIAASAEVQSLPETWRAIRVLGEFGFTETGIVYALSAPLASSNVPTFYISTFKTDFIMVRFCYVLNHSLFWF
jgi:hypothetical protein